jgi:putative SOS response-associated peptidase YedK
MCGRFTLKTSIDDLLLDLFTDGSMRALIETTGALPIEPRYNIAPTQDILVILADDSNQLKIERMRWGLIPFWADSLQSSYSMFNARSESLAEKTSFKSLLSSHRCAVLADGYYEWQKTTPKTKTPFWIHRQGNRPFAMAGLWTINRKIRANESIQSATIITVESNEDTREVHDRMPAMLMQGEQILDWVTRSDSADAMKRYLHPAAVGEFCLKQVSTMVNNVKHEGPSLLEGLPASS